MDSNFPTMPCRSKELDQAMLALSSDVIQLAFSSSSSFPAPGACYPSVLNTQVDSSHREERSRATAATIPSNHVGFLSPEQSCRFDGGTISEHNERYEDWRKMRVGYELMLMSSLQEETPLGPFKPSSSRSS